MSTNRILTIVTNVAEYEMVGYRTGLWLGELTSFYEYVRENGFEVHIASPSGGFVPLDPESLSRDHLSKEDTSQRYRDREFMNLLEETGKVSEVSLEDYDAIYLAGGHGVMFDFAQSDELESLIARFYESDRVVSAVCHGPAGLLNVNLTSGEPLVKGKNVTGFSWREEELARRTDAVPYSLQSELERLGGNYSMAAQPFAPHVVKDGRLITGQNSLSARPLAEAVVEHLKSNAAAESAATVG